MFQNQLKIWHQQENPLNVYFFLIDFSLKKLILVFVVFFLENPLNNKNNYSVEYIDFTYIMNLNFIFFKFS